MEKDLLLSGYTALPRPLPEDWKFVEDLKSFSRNPAPPGKKLTGWDDGVVIKNSFSDPEHLLDTVFPVLERTVACRGGKLSAAGKFPVIMEQRPDLGQEEFILNISPGKIRLSASDTEGMRRAVYALEEKLRSTVDGRVVPCRIRRKPWIRNRISRCFFAPTNRPPLNIDELISEMDYYPEAYLDRLASEGVNGLWLTIYFKDLPSATFPGFGGDAQRRFAKLRRVVQRCRRYGIRIFVFFSEPKFFGDGSYRNPLDQHARQLQFEGSEYHGMHSFCNASPFFADHIRYPVEALFREVPDLGGIINIMSGEDNGSCATIKLAGLSVCPRCASFTAAELYRDCAQIFLSAMRKYNPAAEFIGWFYAPAQRDDDREFARKIGEIAEKWPAEAVLMLNFESGCQFEQLKKKRIVYDYSLAAVGPSRLFAETAQRVVRSGAKLQVCCSHEDASVPFIPVPGNLYRKYRAMRRLKVDTVMQCWYFGNYPGLMNRAAGRLSFAPFPESEKTFLTALAEPAWGKAAASAAAVFRKFGAAYRNFPANIAFAWYGPLHNSIVWPLYVIPRDAPLAPSWLLDQYPAVSGDRIGEALGFHHTLEEAVILCGRMDKLWRQGVGELSKLVPDFKNDPERLSDIGLAKAIGLQIASAKAVLEFYHLREKMYFEQKDLRKAMQILLDEEIRRTVEMTKLCCKDSRLGYHPEAENYLFYPEKLRARVKLLRREKRILAKLQLDSPVIRRYTGRDRDGVKSAVADGSRNELSDGKYFRSLEQDGFLWFEVNDAEDLELCLELELRRLFPPLRIILTGDGKTLLSPWLCRKAPEIRVRRKDGICTVGIPMDFIASFRGKSPRLRFNISGFSGGKTFFWTERIKSPVRLLFDDFTPSAAGWLLLCDGGFPF